MFCLFGFHSAKPSRTAGLSSNLYLSKKRPEKLYFLTTFGVTSHLSVAPSASMCIVRNSVAKMVSVGIDARKSIYFLNYRMAPGSTKLPAGSKESL